jgi:hypothetical protein
VRWRVLVRLATGDKGADGSEHGRPHIRRARCAALGAGGGMLGGERAKQKRVALQHESQVASRDSRFDALCQIKAEDPCQRVWPMPLPFRILPNLMNFGPKQCGWSTSRIPKFVFGRRFGDCAPTGRCIRTQTSPAPSNSHPATKDFESCYEGFR